DYSPTYDQARQELYFMRRTPGRFDYAIHRSRWRDGAWTRAEPASFSSAAHRDAGPYLSPDGETLYFDSRRPAAGLEADSINLWRVSRRGDGWSEAELLRGASANPPQVEVAGNDEFGPVVDGDGDLWFYSFRSPNRGGSRYRTRPEADAAARVEQSIPDPSAPTFVSYLYLSPDGVTALMDGRAWGRRDGDLYFACRGPEGRFGPARPIPEVNTTSGEQGPALSADGHILFWASDRRMAGVDEGRSRLWWVSTDRLPLPCPASAESMPDE
ncbi:MAG: hypothetical protein ACPGJE_03170, partial [Wenzhouxiangellaceae bacterium]